MKLFNLIFAALFIFSCNTSVTQNKSALTKLRTFEMPGVGGRIDHLSIDLKSNRLFVAALGNGTVEVLNLTNGKVIYSIKNLKEPQGVEYIQQYNLLFITSAGDGTCKIFNASTFKLLKVIQLGNDADNIHYNKKRNIVFIGFGSGGIAAISPSDMKLLYRIDLPAHPEAFQMDEKNGLMFVNVPGAGQMEVINIDKRRVIEKIDLKVRGNFPMALDTLHQLIFTGSRSPSKLIIFDATTLKMISEKNISGDADDIFNDLADSLIFVSCGNGSINIFKHANSENIFLKEKVKTVPGARTSLFVPELNELFIAARKYNGYNARVFEYSIK